eukprot:TCONS_00017954-protein
MHTISMQRRKIVLLCICIVVMALLAAATGGNQWILTHGHHIGLWNECTRYDGFCYIPHRYRSIDALKVIKALMILACLSAIAAFLFNVYIVCVGENAAKYISICLLASAIFTMIALIIFMTNGSKFLRFTNNNPYSYGWCFVLGWLAVGFSILGAVGGLKIGVTYQMHKAVMV